MEEGNGWIKLYRKLLNKAIWKCSTPEQKVILITLLLLANHKEEEWEWKGQKFMCKPGQFVTSLNSIAQKAGRNISIQNVRTALDKFKKYDFLTYESTKTGRLVTIVNYSVYQSRKESNQQSNQQRANKEVTTNKNDKKIYINNNSAKNEQNAQLAENIWKLYPCKKGKARAIQKIPKLIQKYGYEQIENTVLRYKKYVQHRRETDFKDLKYQNGSTFFGGTYMDYLDENYKEQAEENSSNVQMFDFSDD